MEDAGGGRTLDDEEAEQKDELVDSFCEMNRKQIVTHSNRFLKSHPLLRSCFGEKEIGLIFAKHLLGHNLEDTGVGASAIYAPIVGAKKIA